MRNEQVMFAGQFRDTASLGKSLEPLRVAPEALAGQPVERLYLFTHHRNDWIYDDDSRQVCDGPKSRQQLTERRHRQPRRG